MAQRNISKNIVMAAVETQNHLCAYCRLPFGTVASTRKGETVQNVIGDHWQPFSYLENSTASNCVASCQICNGLKSSTLFESLEHASVAILAARYRKRISVAFIPETPLTLNPEQWAREYAAYVGLGA